VTRIVLRARLSSSGRSGQASTPVCAPAAAFAARADEDLRSMLDRARPGIRPTAPPAAPGATQQAAA